MPLKDKYIYKGINVSFCKKENIYDLYNEFAPDKVLIPFYPGCLNKYLISKINKEVLVWVHGVEALSWVRRIFNLEIRNIVSFMKYIVGNIIQLRRFKELVKISNSKQKKVTFIFVSNWMKKITEKDTGEKIKNYKIIPNYIDTDFFQTEKKDNTYSNKILLIRNFDSKKYATDIAFKGLEILKKIVDNPKKFKITIVGKGKYLKKLEPKLKGLDYTIINNYLNHDEILKLHGCNGIFLCPTRQDSQGVSMCEAMSSGLVCIASNNTAIPEFLSPNCGILTNNKPYEIAEAIKYLNENSNYFESMSKNARLEIIDKAGFEKTIKEELDLIINKR